MTSPVFSRLPCVSWKMCSKPCGGLDTLAGFAGGAGGSGGFSILTGFSGAFSAAGCSFFGVTAGAGCGVGALLGEGVSGDFGDLLEGAGPGRLTSSSSGSSQSLLSFPGPMTIGRLGGLDLTGTKSGVVWFAPKLESTPGGSGMSARSDCRSFVREVSSAGSGVLREGRKTGVGGPCLIIG